VIKGVNFQDLCDAGTPVELAAAYDSDGADELTFLDVTASAADQETTYDVGRRTAECVFIPLTVGGGVRSTDDMDRQLRGRGQGEHQHRVDRPPGSAGRGVAPVRRSVHRAVGGRPALAGDAVRVEVTTHGGRHDTGITGGTPVPVAALAERSTVTCHQCRRSPLRARTLNLPDKFALQRVCGQVPD
jgi:imidazole glycerol-phosphate synthase subunit HisF